MMKTVPGHLLGMRDSGVNETWPLDSETHGLVWETVVQTQIQ